ncbi:hypothetical protein AA0313_2045 [Acetobacter indonesiensis NRIC 0313]|uniref:Integrase n=1 Tax=Acetobacter indonesiensis TaxID=104101 RepID=A0A252AIX2_9PROT|nr:hypothetical protein [Acetobacter indonesiensis]OUI89546.1 hypothetical protein HK17_15575 [Acetobacter indonesiensis]GAN64026.1 integrase [Acetobacter indonesiensis]GBQ59274.1 hypothetical protein AA0313_2045 [Acetobacter indonesiensis NRIC 0313]GEN04948.1 hypothetical protein AIN02nite_29730 [Acetobacter indonesiensis]
MKPREKQTRKVIRKPRSTKKTPPVLMLSNALEQFVLNNPNAITHRSQGITTYLTAITTDNLNQTVEAISYPETAFKKGTF